VSAKAQRNKGKSEADAAEARRPLGGESAGQEEVAADSLHSQVRQSSIQKRQSSIEKRQSEGAQQSAAHSLRAAQSHAQAFANNPLVAVRLLPSLPTASP